MARGINVDRRRILLIDDNPNDVELALGALDESHDTEIQVASSGAEALRLLLDRQTPLPDLILLDLKMPHMDGLAVLDAIRGEARLPDLPVVMLTTSGDERDIQASYAHGASGYVVKPLEFGQFRLAMSTIQAFWMGLNRRPC